MKRKVVYLLSTVTLFLFLSVVGVNAQVTIGANNPPHPGAVLDLQGEKGLLLPKENLEKADNFQLSSTGASDAIGMMIYNLNETMIGGKGKGVYVWSGTKWMCVCSENKPATVTQKVTGITINGLATVATEKTITFTASVSPENADNKSVTWSVSGGDAATINPTTGVLTGVKPGTVDVMATANDGSNIQSNTIRVTVTALEGPTTAGNYAAYCYPSPIGCWMIENSKENKTAAYSTKWGTHEEGERGYYYTMHSVDNNLCPNGYHIPSDAESKTLLNYLDAHAEQKKAWTTVDAALAGGITTGSSPTPVAWGENGYWWTAEKHFILNFSKGGLLSLQNTNTPTNQGYSVRCVKSN